MLDLGLLMDAMKRRFLFFSDSILFFGPSPFIIGWLKQDAIIFNWRHFKVAKLSAIVDKTRIANFFKTVKSENCWRYECCNSQ